MESLVDTLKSTYADKRVLVTGHNGFKGSWLVALLDYLGSEIHGISLPIEEASPFRNFHEARSRISYVQDLRDYENLKSLVEEIKPEIVFHFAAQALVLESYRSPRETFEVNVQGTVNLLDSLSETNCRGVVVATTDKVYKNDNLGTPFKETDEIGGHDPYSFSKSAVEFVVSAWRNISTFDHCKLSTVRAGNVFGPGDRSPNRLLPDLLHGLRSNLVTSIRNPQAIRPWQYVLDPLVGYLLVGAKILGNKNLAHSYNFGPSEESFISVQDFISRLQSLVPVRIAIDRTSDNLEKKILKLDSSLAKTDLQWSSITHLEMGLFYTLELDQRLSSVEAIQNHIHSYLNTANNFLLK